VNGLGNRAQVKASTFERERGEHVLELRGVVLPRADAMRFLVLVCAAAMSVGIAWECHDIRGVTEGAGKRQRDS
jgi:hypothetical protein